jgi:hypothetical protein
VPLCRLAQATGAVVRLYYLSYQSTIPHFSWNSTILLCQSLPT